LKHTRKHERRREESNQGTKQPGTGGLSDQGDPYDGKFTRRFEESRGWKVLQLILE
jgi:hypothetical protein